MVYPDAAKDIIKIVDSTIRSQAENDAKILDNKRISLHNEAIFLKKSQT